MTMNGELLDFKEVFQENRGAMHSGRLQLLNEKIVFKYSKTGKIENIASNDIVAAFWRRVAKDHELKLVLRNEQNFKFDGFKENDYERMNSFIKRKYGLDVEKQELSANGWNWGKTHFEGTEMQFAVGKRTAFEIPLNQVSQCALNKDEVTLEFHQHDESELSLLEMRFFVPPTQDGEGDRVKDFHENVLSKADILQVKGTAICVFQDMQCLTPRGRYDIRMYPKFVQLHGKTFDYKITYTSILRLFLLPHNDQRQIFFVVSLDPPLKQGQTRYHYLILLFYKEDDLDVEMSLTEEEVQERFNGKLEKNMSGPMYEIVSRVMKQLVNKRITVPGSYRGSNGVQSIPCTYKASSGFLFPLERGFMYVHKPPIHIRLEEIGSVNFARGATKINRSFDFEIETKSKTMYVFSNIVRELYQSLFDFVSSKKLKIKNIGKDGANYDGMEGSDDDADDHPDHYLMRMQQEGRERDSESEDDEDFNPVPEKDDIDEEYDSDANSNNSEKASDESGSAEEEESEEEEKVERKKSKKKKKDRQESSARGGGGKKKVKKDPNAPKRPASAYMLWLSANRKRFNEENPGISIVELSKLAGEKWRSKTSEDKSKWEKQYRSLKEEYEEKMKEYRSSGASDRFKNSSSPATKTKRRRGEKTQHKTTVSPHKIKSKEFITVSDSMSSDSDEGTSQKKAKKETSEEEASASSTPASNSD